MKLVHLVCILPSEKAGEYYFDYLGDLLEFLHGVPGLSPLSRRDYMRHLMKEGIASLHTDRYVLGATLDLEQYDTRYRRVSQNME